MSSRNTRVTGKSRLGSPKGRPATAVARACGEP